MRVKGILLVAAMMTTLVGHAAVTEETLPIIECEDTATGATVTQHFKHVYTLGFMDSAQLEQVREQNPESPLSLAFELRFASRGRNIILRKSGPLAAGIREFETLQRILTGGEGRIETRTESILVRILDQAMCTDPVVENLKQGLIDGFNEYTFVNNDSERFVSAQFTRTRQQMMSDLLDQMDEVLNEE